MKRKQNRLKLTIILILLIACISTVYGQVTIGSNLEPVKGALLDLKEKDDSSGGITSEKGLNLPRVSLTSLTDITNGDITGIDATNKNAHIGLTVYNVREDTPNGFFKCVYVWEGTKWVSLCDGSACPLVLKSTANSNSNDKYTDIVGYTANVSTTAYAIKGECCTKSGNYKYEILSGTGLTSSVTDVGVPSPNSTGELTVTFKTENPDTKPRIALIKVTDPCDNTAYFTAVQQGKPAATASTTCYLAFGGTSPDGSGYADKPYWIAKASGDVMSGNNPNNTVTAISSCCPASSAKPFTISITGENFDNSGNHLVFVSSNTTSTTTNNGQFRLKWNTANQSTTPRVAVVKIVDNCDNVGYFTVIQGGNGALTFSGTSPDGSDYADKPYWVAKASGDVMSGNNPDNTVTAKSSSCPASQSTPFTISIIGGNFDNNVSGVSNSEVEVTNINKSNGTFRIRWNTPNPGTAPRVAVVKVVDYCGNVGYFTTVQKGKPCSMTFTSGGPYAIIESTVRIATTDVSSTCCTIDGTLKNRPVSCIPTGSYATAKTENGTLTVTFANDNTGTEDRTALVTITDDCGNTGYFTVVQKGKAAASTACQLELKSIQADRSSADKYTDIVEYTANASTTAYAVKGDCCPTNGYTYEVIWGDGVLTNPTSGNNTTGRFTVTYNTENTDPAPRVTVIKVKDACDNYAYFTAVQKGKAETGTSFAAVGSFTPGPGVQQSGIGTPALDTFWGKIMPGGKYRVYIHTTATSWNAGTYYIYLQVRTQPGTDVWAEQRFQLKHRNFTPSSSITYTSPGTGNDMGQSSQASIGDAIGLGLLDSYVNFNGTPATGKGYAEFDTEGKDWKNGGDDGAIRIQTWSGTHRIDGFVRWE